MRWLAALLILTALAGCVDDAPEPEPEPVDDTPIQQPPITNETIEEPVEELLEPFTFSGLNCNSLVVQHIDEFSVVGADLPPGFVPADFMSLLKLQETANLGQGVFGPVPVHCASNNLNGNEFSFVLPGTLVDHPILDPPLEEAWIQGYMVEIAVDDEEIADLFEKYHWKVTRNATFDITAPLSQELPNPGDVSRVPAIRGMQLESTENGEFLMTAEAAGGAAYHLFDPEGGSDIIRFYHDSPDGLTYIDNRVDRHGLSGATGCSYGTPASRFGEMFGERTGCSPNDSISIMVYDFTFETTLIFLPGVHA